MCPLGYCERREALFVINRALIFGQDALHSIQVARMPMHRDALAAPFLDRAAARFDDGLRELYFAEALVE
jgi:hypothetical protein